MLIDLEHARKYKINKHTFAREWSLLQQHYSAQASINIALQMKKFSRTYREVCRNFGNLNLELLGQLTLSCSSENLKL